MACRVLRVAASGYYGWRDRPPSNRLVEHAWLAEAIVGVHAASLGSCGTRRVHAELRLGPRIHVSHRTVELLMQRAGLHCLPGNRRLQAHHPVRRRPGGVELHPSRPGPVIGHGHHRAPHF
ncbi:IS3 family transposase [Streptomyces phaeochromogenes]